MKPSFRQIVRKAIFCILPALLLACFNNCSGDFKAAEMNNESLSIVGAQYCALPDRNVPINTTVSGFQNSAAISPIVCGNQVTRTCLPSGGFDGPMPIYSSCAQKCVNPDNSQILDAGNSYTSYTRASGSTAECSAAQVISTCSATSGRLEPSPPVLRFSTCLVAGQTCAYASGPGYAVPTGNAAGSTVTGFQVQNATYPSMCGTTQTRTCQSGGSWSGSTPLFTSCVQRCVHPDSGQPVDANYQYSYFTRSTGSSAECDAARAVSTCQQGSGMFNPAVPSTRFASCSAIGTPRPDLTVTVNSGTYFQTMDGFGASERVFDDPHVTETFNTTTKRATVTMTTAQQDQILDLLYTDLRLTRIRPVTEAKVELVNDNSDPNSTDLTKFDFSWKQNDAHIDIVKRTQLRGVSTFFLSPVSIESWMGTSTNNDVLEYSEWAMTIIRRWRSLGVELPYYSVANEPGYVRNPMTGEFIRDVIKNMGPRLRAEGFQTRFVITDDLNPAQAFLRCQIILADATARPYIGAIATHLYGGRDLTNLTTLSQQYGLPLWMTEYSREAARTDGLGWAELMHDLISRYNVSAIDYMWGFFGAWESGTQLISLQYNDPRLPDYNSSQGPVYKGYTLDKTYYTTAQFSRYVRPGARRVSAVSTDSTLRVSAYRQGQTMVIVVINNSASDKVAEFDIGAGVDRVYPVRTSETENLVKFTGLTVTTGKFTSSLKARSVTTFTSDQLAQ